MGIIQLQTIRHTMRLMGLVKSTIEVMPAHFQHGNLPTAHCQLPIAYCLLPTAYFFYHCLFIHKRLFS